MTPEQVLWEQTLERAQKDLEDAERYGDFGTAEWNKELIEVSRRKIQEYEEYEKQHKRGA